MTEQEKLIGDLRTNISGLVRELHRLSGELMVHRHTDMCLRYAAQTGQPFCIAECQDHRADQMARINETIRDFGNTDSSTGCCIRVVTSLGPTPEDCTSPHYLSGYLRGLKDKIVDLEKDVDGLLGRGSTCRQ